MWLGGLFNPEAYITATRQCIAQANSWPLEELELDVTITDSSDKNSIPTDCFSLIGMLNELLIIVLCSIKNFDCFRYKITRSTK